MQKGWISRFHMSIKNRHHSEDMRKRNQEITKGKSLWFSPELRIINRFKTIPFGVERIDEFRIISHLSSSTKSRYRQHINILLAHGTFREINSKILRRVKDKTVGLHMNVDPFWHLIHKRSFISPAVSRLSLDQELSKSFPLSNSVNSLRLIQSLTDSFVWWETFSLRKQTICSL